VERPEEAEHEPGRLVQRWIHDKRFHAVDRHSQHLYQLPVIDQTAAGTGPHAFIDLSWYIPWIRQTGGSLPAGTHYIFIGSRQPLQTLRVQKILVSTSAPKRIQLSILPDLQFTSA